MARALRLDFMTIEQETVEETASGALRIPARLARVGVLEYEDNEGNRWGELVPEEELFREDSLATLRGVALTDLHPDAQVTPANYRELNIGHVGDDVRRDGCFVAAPVYVSDATAIERVKSGERKDVSCGYLCDFDETPGVWEGTPYKRIQRGRAYNHLGLGPEGWGRAGTEVSLRLDGAAVAVRPSVPRAHVRADGSQPTGAKGVPAKGTIMKGLKVRGKTYRADADEEMTEAQKKVDELEAEAAKSGDLGKQLDAATDALTEALKTVAQLKAELAVKNSATPGAVTEEQVPEDVQDSIAKKRLALRDRALAVLGKTDAKGQPVKLDGLSADEIRRKAIVHVVPGVKLDGLDAKAIERMFEALASKAEAERGSKEAERADTNRRLADVLVPEAGDEGAARTDGTREDGDDDPSATMHKSTTERWQQPLSHRKGA